MPTSVTPIRPTSPSRPLGASHARSQASHAAPVQGAGRNSRLFRDHPISGTFTTKRGDVLPTPYHAYDADALIVSGTGDLKELRTLVGGGFQPLSTTGGRGIVRLWIMDYKDTSVGPYQELVVTIDVSRDERPVVPIETAYSIMAPQLDPSVVTFVWRLLLPEGADAAIDYGREVLGLDKRPAGISITREGAMKRFSFEENARTVLSGHVREDDRFETEVKSVAGLLAAAGLMASMKALKPIFETKLVTKDVMGLRIFKWTAGYIDGKPILNVLQGDELTFGDATEIGAALGRMEFKPLVSSRNRHLQLVLEESEPVTRMTIVKTLGVSSVTHALRSMVGVAP